MKKVYLYRGYERFWHWSQTVLVFILLISGFEIHGSYELLGYESAVNTHNTTAWVFLILTAFTIFWHLTTDMWRQYIPSKKNLDLQIEYYVSGMFKNMPHPTGKTLLSKLNPLQKIVYTALKVLVFPVMFITGFLYLYFNFPLKCIELNSLESIAVLHTIGAYILVSFIIIHLYLITTGRTVFSNLKAMVTGWEDVDDEEVEEVIKDVMESANHLIKEKVKTPKSKKKPKNSINDLSNNKE